MPTHSVILTYFNLDPKMRNVLKHFETLLLRGLRTTPEKNYSTAVGISTAMIKCYDCPIQYDIVLMDILIFEGVAGPRKLVPKTT